jgi:hypothetical protein
MISMSGQLGESSRLARITAQLLLHIDFSTLSIQFERAVYPTTYWRSLKLARPVNISAVEIAS